MAVTTKSKNQNKDSPRNRSAKKPVDSRVKTAPLTPKQARFADEYIIDLNGTQAVIRAGYSHRGADVQAVRLLGDARIAARIAELQKKRSERTEITQDRVLQEVARLAFLDIRRAFKEDGSLKPVSEMDDDTAAAIAGIEVTEIAGTDLGVIKKVRLSDKKGSLELLMRHLGMLNDKMKLQGDAENPLAVLLQQVDGTSLPIKGEE